MLLVARGTSGVTGAIEMAPYCTTQDWQEGALIAFEKGWIKLDLPAPLVLDQAGRVTVFEDPGKGAQPRTTIPTLPYVHAMRQQALNFVKTLRGEQTPLCECEEGLKDLGVAESYLNLKERKACH